MVENFALPTVGRDQSTPRKRRWTWICAARGEVPELKPVVEAMVGGAIKLKIKLLDGTQPRRNRSIRRKPR